MSRISSDEDFNVDTYNDMMPEQRVARINSGLEENTRMSLNVEMSDRGRQREFNEEDAISEHSQEEGGSTPPGTIGDRNEIMSEHIQNYGHHFDKKRKGKAMTNVNDDITQSELSKRVQASQATRMTNVVTCSAPIPLAPDNHLQAFRDIYDELYAEFHEQLKQQYEQMRGSYMSEHQTNFEQNSNRKMQKVQEFNDQINAKNNQINAFTAQKKQLKTTMKGRFAQSIDRTLKLRVLEILKYRVACKRRRDKIKKLCEEHLHERKLRAFFFGWRQVSHTWFRQRVDREEKDYRLELESQQLVQWSTKVDQMLIYMAELEDKIKTEQIAREQLALEYEQSLNQGVDQLNVETRNLQQDPRLKEIQLVVAQQLLQKSQHDPQLKNLLESNKNRMTMNTSKVINQVWQPQ